MKIMKIFLILLTILLFIVLGYYIVDFFKVESYKEIPTGVSLNLSMYPKIDFLQMDFVLPTKIDVACRSREAIIETQGIIEKNKITIELPYYRHTYTKTFPGGLDCAIRSQARGSVSIPIKDFALNEEIPLVINVGNIPNSFILKRTEYFTSLTPVDAPTIKLPDFDSQYRFENAPYFRIWHLPDDIGLFTRPDVNVTEKLLEQQRLKAGGLELLEDKYPELASILPEIKEITTPTSYPIQKKWVVVGEPWINQPDWKDKLKIVIDYSDDFTVEEYVVKHWSRILPGSR